MFYAGVCTWMYVGVLDTTLARLFRRAVGTWNHVEQNDTVAAVRNTVDDSIVRRLLFYLRRSEVAILMPGS